MRQANLHYLPIFLLAALNCSMSWATMLSLYYRKSENFRYNRKQGENLKKKRISQKKIPKEYSVCLKACIWKILTDE